ncbi:DUF1642 domain-containing protein [Lactococcus lactis]|uniref:DUF1642 domain-containing protein n=1 Tax=Lactococcus lactis TaxID=1358 RepID=UPI00223A80F6|nr:DUF1642 domain-containing protein [Lactococcus lactis]MCT1170178.1 DUF1642 domain-containing protein [Lactococcus lactis]
MSELEHEVGILRAENLKLRNEVARLSHPDLPVVPVDIDNAIKYLQTHVNAGSINDFKDVLTEKGFWWLNDFQYKDRRFGFGGLNNKLFILSYLAITGYEVEKPKEQPKTAKKYIEHVIGTIKHDGHLGTIQIDWILPYLEKALAAIGGDDD